MTCIGLRVARAAAHRMFYESFSHFIRTSFTNKELVKCLILTFTIYHICVGHMMALVRSNSRRLQAKKDLDLETQNPSKNYTLDAQKAIDKKLQHCDRETVAYEMKAGKNFTAEFSTAAFEVFRGLLPTFIRNMCDNSHPPLAVTDKPNTDISGAVVETVYTISNKRSDGTVGKQAKCVVHVYNTQSGILANGSKVDIFVQDVFHPIVDKLKAANDTLQIVNREYKQAVERFTCPLCRRRANDGTIQCDTCLEWMHYECVNLTEESVRKIPQSVPFNCPLCVNNAVYSTTDDTPISMGTRRYRDITSINSSPDTLCKQTASVPALPMTHTSVSAVTTVATHSFVRADRPAVTYVAETSTTAVVKCSSDYIPIQSIRASVSAVASNAENCVDSVAHSELASKVVSNICNTAPAASLQSDNTEVPTIPKTTQVGIFANALSSTRHSERTLGINCHTASLPTRHESLHTRIPSSENRASSTRHSERTLGITCHSASPPTRHESLHTRIPSSENRATGDMSRNFGRPTDPITTQAGMLVNAPSSTQGSERTLGSVYCHIASPPTRHESLHTHNPSSENRATDDASRNFGRPVVPITTQAGITANAPFNARQNERTLGSVYNRHAASPPTRHTESLHARNPIAANRATDDTSRKRNVKSTRTVDNSAEKTKSYIAGLEQKILDLERSVSLQRTLLSQNNIIPGSPSMSRGNHTPDSSRYVPSRESAPEQVVSKINLMEDKLNLVLEYQKHLSNNFITSSVLNNSALLTELLHRQNASSSVHMPSAPYNMHIPAYAAPPPYYAYHAPPPLVGMPFRSGFPPHMPFTHNATQTHVMEPVRRVDNAYTGQPLFHTGVSAGRERQDARIPTRAPTQTVDSGPKPQCEQPGGDIPKEPLHVNREPLQAVPPRKEVRMEHQDAQGGANTQGDVVAVQYSEHSLHLTDTRQGETTTMDSNKQVHFLCLPSLPGRPPDRIRGQSLQTRQF